MNNDINNRFVYGIGDNYHLQIRGGIAGGRNNTNTVNNYNMASARPHGHDLYQALAPVMEAAHDRSGPISKCHVGTRRHVIGQIWQCIEGNNNCPICWLSGPAGYGKSAISQAIADSYAANNRLAASFFFLRGTESRSTIARLIPTLSYQLSISMPDTKPFIRRTIETEPHLSRQALQHQFRKLIMDPILAASRSTLLVKYVIVIDALDECNDKDAMGEFIETVIEAMRANPGVPIRFLITSRVEEHIRRKLETRPAQSTVYRLSLEEFDAKTDIRTFFRSNFDTIYVQNRRLMRNVSRPWPSESDLSSLVETCGGSFIFAVTLMNIMRDDGSLPQHNFWKAFTARTGLDALYASVLSRAPRNEHFERIIGTVMLLRSPLPVIFLAHLLRLQPEDIVQALLGVQSVLLIPGDDDEAITLSHTSLRDYLVSRERSGVFFINPSTRHFAIAIDCLRVLAVEPDEGIFFVGRQKYACLNWFHHILEGLQTDGDVPNVLSETSLVEYLINFATQTLKIWVNTVLTAGYPKVLDTFNSLISALERFPDLRNSIQVLKTTSEVRSGHIASGSHFDFLLYVDLTADSWSVSSFLM